MSGFTFKANGRGIASLLLEPGVADLVDDKAKELANVAARAAKEVNGLSWQARYNYHPPRSYSGSARQAVIAHMPKDRTRGTKAKSGVGRRRTGIVAFHPDAKGRKAGRMAIRKALRLPSLEALDADTKARAQKRADRAYDRRVAKAEAREGMD